MNTKSKVVTANLKNGKIIRYHIEATGRGSIHSIRLIDGTGQYADWLKQIGKDVHPKTLKTLLSNVGLTCFLQVVDGVAVSPDFVPTIREGTVVDRFYSLDRKTSPPVPLLDHAQTSLAYAGLGTGVGVGVKRDYFARDLATLLKKYDVVLAEHPSAPRSDLYIVNRGTSFADGAAKVMG